MRTSFQGIQSCVKLKVNQIRRVSVDVFGVDPIEVSVAMVGARFTVKK